jgi:hypothetical protein
VHIRGSAAAVSGYLLFEIDSLLLGSIMTFCAGGFLYRYFHVAPAAKSGDSWYPAFGAILGFSSLGGYGLTDNSGTRSHYPIFFFQPKPKHDKSFAITISPL